MLLPVGFDNFQEVVYKNLNFVDKSFFIKEILDDAATKVAVITRPRRFGKTLNLSMLHHFLSEKVYGLETKDLFNGLKIANYPEYMQHQGKYPVISISFKDIKSSSYQLCYEKLCQLMSHVYFEHRKLLDSTKLSSHQKEEFERILREKSSISSIHASLYNLTNYLYLEHQKKAWLLIDEYDTPIQAGYVNGYYTEIIDLMRGLLGAALKSNHALEKAVVTGILRVAKESLFSGVNNLKVYSIFNPSYSEYFGFTESEMDSILSESNLLQKASEIKQWYNGYKIGETTIYNPWSIANCIREKGAIEPYWINTSDNQLIKDLLRQSSLSFKQDFEVLTQGGCVEKLIDEQMVFHYLNNNPSSVWGLLLMSGYLKPVSYRKTDQGNFVMLGIPNREVGNLYRQIIEQWLSNGHGIEWYNEFIEALLVGDIKKFKKHLDDVILQITSYHDMSKEPEAFYHGLLLGFISSLHRTHEVKSNRESGLGRFDIMIISRDIKENTASVILELKIKEANETLEETARKALLQIESKQYDAEFKQRRVKKIIKVGIGFEGKVCAEAHEIVLTESL